MRSVWGASLERIAGLILFADDIWTLIAIISDPPTIIIVNNRQIFFQKFFQSTLIQIQLNAQVAGHFVGDLESLKDYESVFHHAALEVPKGITNWQDDVDFGYQKLAGVNPGMIKLCQKVPER